LKSKSKISVVFVIVWAYGLGLIFDVPTGDAQLPCQRPNGFHNINNGQFRWYGKTTSSHNSSSQSTDTESGSDSEVCQAPQWISRRRGSGERSRSSIINVPDMTGKTIEFLESIRSSMPPTSLLVACVEECTRSLSGRA
ncbi:hypothetical protein T4E_7035, partial [Trichinella pseudospiralis]